jgi:hydrogenase maturation protease
MARALVIGYGNTLRGDDGIGYIAAQELSRMIDSPDVQIIACQQLTPELAKDVSESERVILVDAATGTQPGKIMIRKISPTRPQPIFAHELRPETLLAYSREIYGRCPEAYLISITSNSFRLGEELSHELSLKLAEVNNQILKLANSITG